MLEEWQRIGQPETAPAELATSEFQISNLKSQISPIPLTQHRPTLVRQVRNHLLMLVTALAHDQTETALGLVEPADSAGKLWTPERLMVLLDAYHAARLRIRLDPEARNARHTRIPELPAAADFHQGLPITQTLIDADDHNDWAVYLTLDLAESNRTHTPILRLETISPG
jgi:hypothetical protein